MSDWIPVDERMPDDEIDVMIAIDVERPRSKWNDPVWIGWHDGAAGCWRVADGLRVDVTHWMELPEPPKAPGGNDERGTMKAERRRGGGK